MSISPQIRVGAMVQLVTPDNQRLNGKFATVKQPTHYGALLFCPDAYSGEFRASWEEMIYVDSPYNTSTADNTESKAQGYTGDVCPKCSSLKMVRNQSCLLCMDCFETTGCS